VKRRRFGRRFFLGILARHPVTSLWRSGFSNNSELQIDPAQRPDGKAGALLILAEQDAR
jgi:hypothetical protein